MSIERNINQFLVRIGLKKDKRKEFLNSYHQLRASELCRNGQYKDAADELNEELKEHPDNGFAYVLMVEIFGRQGNYGMALQACNDALKLIPECGTRYDLAHVYWQRSQMHKALNDRFQCKCDAEMCVKIDPNSVNGLEQLGDYYYGVGDYVKAETMFKKVTELEPHNAPVYVNRGQVENARGNYEAAIKHYEHAALLDRNYTPALALKAESLLNLGRVKDAVEVLVDVLEADRYTELLDSQLSRAIALGGYDLLCLKINGIIVRNRDDAFWYGLMGWIHYGKPDFKQSVLACQKAFDMSQNGCYLHSAAMAWMHLGAFGKAIEAEKKVIELLPADVNNALDLAEYYCEASRFEDGLIVVNNLISNVPNCAEGFYCRGICYLNLGQYENAIADFDTSITLRGVHAHVFMYKACALKLCGNNYEAEKALMFIVDDESLMYRNSVLGLALAELGQLTEARNEVDARVKEADKSTAWRRLRYVYLYAMVVYAKLGMMQKAMECLHKHFNRAHGYNFTTLLVDPMFRLLQRNGEFVVTVMRYRQQYADALLDIDGNIPVPQTVST